MAKRVVLAYSGGLDTSACVKWIQEEWGAEVVALAADVGQGGDFDAIRERATAAGAIEAIVVDARAEYAAEYIAPAIKANALYEGKYPLVSALSRPVIARHLVAAAREHGADGVAHGCTGKGNDQVRFEVSVRALAPDLEVLAPVRVWGLTRDDSIEYARRFDIPITVTREKPYSVDENFVGRVGLLAGDGDGDVEAAGVLDRVVAGEAPDAHGREHLEIGSEGPHRHLETHLVVPFPGAAVSDSVGAVLAGGRDQMPGDHRARQRRHEWVFPLVEGVGADRGRDVLAAELLSQVDDERLDRAGRARPRADGVEVAALPDVGRERDHFRAPFLRDPLDGHRGVETTGVRENDPLGHAHVLPTNPRATQAAVSYTH